MCEDGGDKKNENCVTSVMDVHNEIYTTNDNHKISTQSLFAFACNSCAIVKGPVEMTSVMTMHYQNVLIKLRYITL